MKKLSSLALIILMVVQSPLRAYAQSCDEVCTCDGISCPSPVPSGAPAPTPPVALDTYCASHTMEAMGISFDVTSLVLGAVSLGICLPACIDPLSNTDGLGEACTALTYAGLVFTLAAVATTIGEGAQLDSEISGASLSSDLNSAFGTGSGGFAGANTAWTGVSWIVDLVSQFNSTRGVSCASSAIGAIGMALTVVDMGLTSKALTDDCNMINSLSSNSSQLRNDRKSYYSKNDFKF